MADPKQPTPPTPIGVANSSSATVVEYVSPAHNDTATDVEGGRGGRLFKLFRWRIAVPAYSFIIYLIAVALAICLLVFLSSSQGFVLAEIIGVPSDQLGDSAGSLSFYDQLMSLPSVYLWGVASDRIGRRTVYSLGFFTMAIALASYTFAKNLYPQLLIIRLIFAVGGAASSSMVTAVLADYAGEQDRGKIAGVVGIVSGLGALLALFVFLPLPARFGDDDPVKGLRVTYLVVAGLAVVVAGLAFLGLQRRRNVKVWESTAGVGRSSASGQEGLVAGADEDGAVVTGPVPKRSFWALAREGIAEAKDPKILLGYSACFLARGDTIIITTFVPLWVYKYYIDSGLCPITDPDDPDKKTLCHDAYITSSMLTGIAQTLTIVGAPLFGYLSDRLYRPLTLLISTVLGLLSYLWLFLSPSPIQKQVYFPILLLGLAEIGAVVTSLSLVTASTIPKDARGSVAGVSSFVGALGILINTKVGGVLFDGWRSTGPFFVMVVAHAVVTVIAIWVVFVEVGRERARRRREGGHGSRGVLEELRRQQLEVR